MTRMDIFVTNNTQYNVVHLSYDGSDWADGANYPTGTTLAASSGTAKVIESMGCPGALESDHWGLLNFRAGAAGFPGFYKYFFIYARQQDSGYCNDYGMGKAASEHDHPSLSNVKFGTSTCTPDRDNGGSPKLACVLNVNDLNFTS